VVVCALSFAEGLNIGMLLPLLSLIGVETGTHPNGPAQVIKSFFATLHISLSLGAVLAVFLVIGLIHIALHSLQQYLIVRSGEALTLLIRQRIFDGISFASWRGILSSRGGYLVNAVMSEASRTGLLFGSNMTALGIVISFGIYVGISAWISWPLTLWTGLLCIASILVLRKLFSSSRRFGAYTSAATNRLQEVLNEHVAGAKVIRAFGAGQWSRTIFCSAAEAVGDYARRNQLNTILVRTLVEPFGLVMVCLLIYLSITVLQLPAAELMVLLLLVFRVIPRFVVLQEMLQRTSGMLPAYESVLDTLSRLGQVHEGRGQKIFTELQGPIELRGITVRHDTNTVLDGVSFGVQPRTTVALVGRSGGGKTTLLDIMSGVLTPDDGEALINGTPLSEYDLNSYRQRIGVVPQESTFFHDTIEANLRIAKPGATETELWDVLVAAHADEFVQERPEGLAAIVGDQGLRLSGGQRQRLALARALLRNPDILLLDEPTSAMDVQTELAIRETLRRLRGQVTIVLVTHRQEMAGDADVIYTVSEGIVKPLERVPGHVGGGRPA